MQCEVLMEVTKDVQLILIYRMELILISAHVLLVTMVIIVRQMWTNVHHHLVNMELAQ